MIQACLNGRRTRAEHPAIPLTPEERELVEIIKSEEVAKGCK